VDSYQLERDITELEEAVAWMKHKPRGESTPNSCTVYRVEDIDAHALLNVLNEVRRLQQALAEAECSHLNWHTASNS
jgi:hypothetical protein